MSNSKKELAQDEQQTNIETIKILKRYDNTLKIYREAIKCLDYFNFDEVIERVEDLKKVYHLENGRHASPTRIMTMVYQSLTQRVLRHCTIKNDQFYLFYDKQWIHLTQQAQVITTQFLKMIDHFASQWIEVSQFKKFNDLILNDVVETAPNTIIQFNDCYIDNNQFKEGMYSYSVPEFRIHHDVYDVIMNNEQLIHHDVVDDLIAHLCNNDEDTQSRFLDDLSMCLSNSQKFNQANGKMIRLYGPTSSNGKSTLLELLSQSLNKDNVTSFNVSDLSGYAVELITRHLVAFDPEEQSNYWGLDTSRHVKAFVTSENMLVRKIYHDPVNIKPITTLISATNMMPNTEDKTEGLSRRMDWFYVKKQLKKDDDWFNDLYSEQALDYVAKLLALTFYRLTQRGHLRPVSRQMKLTLEMFNESNNSVISYLNHADINMIKDRRVVFVYRQYEQYCEENALSVMGKQKFNQQLESRLNVVRKNRALKDLNQDETDLEAYTEEAINPDKRVKAWVEV